MCSVAFTSYSLHYVVYTPSKNYFNWITSQKVWKSLKAEENVLNTASRKCLCKRGQATKSIIISNGKSGNKKISRLNHFFFIHARLASDSLQLSNKSGGNKLSTSV